MVMVSLSGLCSLERISWEISKRGSCLFDKSLMNEQARVTYMVIYSATEDG